MLGYPVAVAVADTLEQALDAAERVVVDYSAAARRSYRRATPSRRTRRGSTTNARATRPMSTQAGDKAKVEAAFAAAAHVVEQRLVINR